MWITGLNRQHADCNRRQQGRERSAGCECQFGQHGGGETVADKSADRHHGTCRSSKNNACSKPSAGNQWVVSCVVDSCISNAAWAFNRLLKRKFKKIKKEDLRTLLIFFLSGIRQALASPSHSQLLPNDDDDRWNLAVCSLHQTSIGKPCSRCILRDSLS